MKTSTCFPVALALLLALAACQRKQESAAPAATPEAASSAVARTAGPIILPQPLLPAPSEDARQLGATLAAQGATNVAACASCHGPAGEGNATTGFPRLAGQSYVYLLHELDSYADDSRTHPVMTVIAKSMSTAQREAGTAYYASLDPSPGSGGANTSGTSAAATAKPERGRPGAIDRGRLLASVGDESRQLQACANCHGPDGIGAGVAIPYLASQHAAYLSATLDAWRNGTRHNDPSGQMPLIAQALPDQDIQALASYYARLPLPPRRDAELAARAAPASAAPASAELASVHR
jgi:cytochrome c553